MNIIKMTFCGAIWRNIEGDVILDVNLAKQDGGQLQRTCQQSRLGMAGYPLGLKKEQLKVVVEFLSVFALPLGLGRACLPPLTAIMKH